MSNITILPPLSGTVRQLGWQQSEPFTTPDCLNFVPFNPKDGRAVLASRPFLTDFTSPGTGVNLLENISGDNAGNPSSTIVAARAGLLYFWTGSAWSAATVDAGEVITTGRPVFGTPFFRRLFIANDSADGGMLEYDYELNTLKTPTATAGSFPADARVLATHMGTLWAAGSEEEGHILRGSQTGDPFDWDFTSTDEGAPFQTTGENAGLINEPITALVPIASDMMVVASESSMFSMLGHPSRGGIFFPLSSAVGVLGQGAWCKTDDNQVFAMSHKGLIQIQAQGDGVAALVSEHKLPNSLKGISFNRLIPTISMAYDTRWNGIHIVVNDATRPQAWWYNMKNGGFYRQSYGDSLPLRLLQFDSLVDFTKSGVLYGGDGYGGLARWTVAGPETNRPQAWAFLGPVRIHSKEGPQTKSKIQRAKLTLSNDTDTTKGSLAVFTGVDAEDAFLRAHNAVLGSAAAVQASNAAANNGVFYPRLAGSALVAVIGDEGSGEFGFESLDLEVVPAGRQRQSKVTGLTYDIEFGLDDYSPDYNLPATVGFAQFTADTTLSASVTDAPNFIDLSTAPSRWWRGITSEDGREIKATDVSNNRLPMHILWFDRANRKGMVAVKKTQDGSTGIRLWTKTTQSAIPAVGTTYGQYAAYASWIEFLWALGDGVDVTGNQFNHTALVAFGGTLAEGQSGFKGMSQFTGFRDQAITTPASSVALAFMCERPAAGDDLDSSALEISVAQAAPLIRIERDQFNAQGRAEINDGLGVVTQVDDAVLFPASSYFHSWAMFGGIFEFGSKVTLHLPSGVLSSATTANLPSSGSHVVRVRHQQHFNDDLVAMWQMLDATDPSKITAYFEMLHALLAGTFWGSPVFIPGAEADITE